MIQHGKEKELVNALRKTLLTQATARSRREKEEIPKIIKERRQQLEAGFAEMDALHFDRNMSDDAFWYVAATKPFYAGHVAAHVDARDGYMLTQYLGDREALTSSEWNPGRKLYEEFLDDEGCFRHADNLSRVINAANQISATKVHNSYKTIIDYICRDITDLNDTVSLQSFHKRLNAVLQYGEVTTFHVMTELGLPVVKPDRVVVRVAIAIGIIDSYKSGSKTYPLPKTVTSDEATDLGAIPAFNWALQEACRRIADEAGVSMRLLDFLLVKLGQEPDDVNGFVRTICTESNPTCQLCEVKPMCNYGSRR